MPSLATPLVSACTWTDSVMVIGHVISREYQFEFQVVSLGCLKPGDRRM